MATKTKLPVRRNIEPLFRIASELESHLQRSLNTKNEKIHKNFSANFNSSLAKNSQNENNPLSVEPPKKSAKSPSAAINTNEDTDIDDEDNHEDDDDEIEIKTFDRLHKKNSKILLQEKDDQIEKLVDRLTQLHSSNTDFAAENAHLQQQLQKRIECTACKSVRQQHDDALKAAEEQFHEETRQLRDDVKMMKSLVYRLNVQLERYQEMLRQANATDSAIGRIDFDARDLNWGPVNAHTLGPLLHAYTEIIDEKNALVQQYENDLCHFAGRLKCIVDENDTLQRRMDDMKMSTDMWTTEKTRFEAQLNIFRYDGVEIIPIDIFLSNLFSRNKAEVQTKRADVAKEKLVEVLRCYEQKVQLQNLELERLNEAYARTKGELTALRNIQQTPPEMIVESLKECQKYVFLILSMFLIQF